MNNFEYFNLIISLLIPAFFTFCLVLIQIQENLQTNQLYRALQVRLALFTTIMILMLVIEVFIVAFDQIDFAFYLSELLKSFEVILFIEIVLKSAGFEMIDGKRFSQAQVESVLIKKGRFKGLCGDVVLKNKQEVGWFLLKVRISCIQFCIVSFVEMVLAIFLKFYMNDYLRFGHIGFSSGFFWLMVLKGFSFMLFFWSFLGFGMVFGDVGEIGIEDFTRNKNFLVFFLGFTELQVVAVSVLANFTEVYGGWRNTTKVVNSLYCMMIVLYMIKYSATFKYSQKVIDSKNIDNSSNTTEISSSR